MFKFSDEELSRILSHATTGFLGKVGRSDNEVRKQSACLVQAALANYDGYTSTKEFPEEYQFVAEWFDNTLYARSNNDPDELLKILEKQGYA